MAHLSSRPTQSGSYYPGRKIYVMYHGTDVESAIKIIKYGFKVSEGGTLGRGVYISRNPMKARMYPLCSSGGQVVLKITVKVGKVKKIDHVGHPLQYTWHDNGYDTAWMPVDSGLEEDCVYDPRRIRVVDVFSAPPEHIDSIRQLIARYKK